MEYMIYGSTGYMGKLITRMMVAEGKRPVLAGRSEATKSVAMANGLEYRIFSLEQEKEVQQNVNGNGLLINLAGPYQKTMVPLVNACVATKINYIDISGEATGYKTVYSFNEQAKQAGIMLMPGTGFGIVPTDVLALHLKQMLPDGDKLELGFAIEGGASRGTMRVGLKAMHEPGFELVNGKEQMRKPAARAMSVMIGNRKVNMVLNPWRGDLFTAPITTGIQNVATYSAFPGPLVFMMKNRGLFGGLFKSKLMERIIGWLPEGPDETKLKQGRSFLYGKITNGQGHAIEKVMTGPEAYLYTAIATIRIANRILNGDCKPGFQTPAGLYGTGLVEGIEGVGFL